MASNGSIDPPTVVHATHSHTCQKYCQDPIYLRRSPAYSLSDLVTRREASEMVLVTFAIGITLRLLLPLAILLLLGTLLNGKRLRQSS